jgi:hypothetical protein
MKNTNITRKTDFTAIQYIASRIIKQDKVYIRMLLAEAVKCQPFLASAIVGITSDFSSAESEEVVSLYLIAWGVFRQYPGCREITVTQKKFEDTRKKNISMFEYLDKEDDSGFFDEIVQSDHEKLNHGILMQYIAGCLRKWPGVNRLDAVHYCSVLIGVKSFIESLEDVVGDMDENAQGMEQRA